MNDGKFSGHVHYDTVCALKKNGRRTKDGLSCAHKYRAKSFFFYFKISPQTAIIHH